MLSKTKVIVVEHSFLNVARQDEGAVAVRDWCYRAASGEGTRSRDQAEIRTVTILLGWGWFVSVLFARGSVMVDKSAAVALLASILAPALGVAIFLYVQGLL